MSSRWFKHQAQFHSREAAGRDAHRLGALRSDNPFLDLRGTWAFDVGLARHCWNLGWLEADAQAPQQPGLFD